MGTSASRALPSWPSRKPLRLTLSGSLRTPTFAPSTPSVSPSCPRTSSLPAESAVSVPKKFVVVVVVTPTSAHSPPSPQRPFSGPQYYQKRLSYCIGTYSKKELKKKRKKEKSQDRCNK